VNAELFQAAVADFGHQVREVRGRNISWTFISIHLKHYDKKIRAPYAGAPHILFSAYLRRHCPDQVVKGIFSASRIYSM
jgi:hypothetical protein